MMALKVLQAIQVLMIICVLCDAYPTIYGTKRYGRAPSQRNSWTSTGQPAQAQHYQQMLPSQRYPMNYYDLYPYNQNYDDYYYPHESYSSYPVYYPRTSKYEVYQAVLPYYYDRPLMRSGFYYGYDDAVNPVDDLEEEMIQENEREQREDAQPIGHEMYYENDDTSNYNDVNAAFLQSLIMSQMYKDSLDYNRNYKDSSDYNRNYNNDDEVYGKLDEYPPNNNNNNREDEEVEELKQLAKPYREDKLAEERQRWFQRGNKKQRKHNDKRNFGNVPFTDRKGVMTSTESTSSTTTFAPPKRDARGQKEEVLLRPATPIKHAFTKSINNMMKSNKKDRQRTPSVYDTIKHMLDMEKTLEAEDVKPTMRKRIISSEDSLTHQLSVLKKQK
ncbi:PREDICTED: putative uncharacterized protein DDB_G0292292 [Nicrophorus vespilloides]|uniref:Uncharacterized protein n=1 Tax=Nicrophorus vespilloides TaxID=110193 RepID=A0ABM1ML72_NICVS|nr:PREDICTED: putative uncharacterized protein DDB_G0292292 [Nicrophorus vespilloides]